MAFLTQKRKGIPGRPPPEGVSENIGFRLPFTLTYDGVTFTSVEAVKQNIKNLLNTEKGERVMQPNLGLELKKHLFQPIQAETEFLIKEDLEKQMAIWFPFLIVNNIGVSYDEDASLINFDVIFAFTRAPDFKESVQNSVSAGSTY